MDSQLKYFSLEMFIELKSNQLSMDITKYSLEDLILLGIKSEEVAKEVYTNFWLKKQRTHF
jgi:hypothetical protein